MTPFEAKGWKATDKFRAFTSGYGTFSAGDVVELDRDDGSCIPFFKRTRDGKVSAYYLDGLERVEPQWNGEGLPPVGTACEFKRYISVKWLPGVLSYISDYTAVITLHECDDSGRREEVGHPLTFEFRPIRTEREKEIDEIMECTGLRARDGAKEVATAIYDAGYRKQ